MKNVLAGLAKARKIIASTEMIKEGVNKYSDYKYFTPSQVHKLVEDACQQSNILATFQLLIDGDGYFGQMDVFSIESGESMQFIVRTDVPDIKGTNIAQKIGGAMTYTERYMKQIIFGITDNNLDLDHVQGVANAKTNGTASDNELKTLDAKTKAAMLDFIKSGKSDFVKKRLEAYKDGKNKQEVLNNLV